LADVSAARRARSTSTEISSVYAFPRFASRSKSSSRIHATRRASMEPGATGGRRLEHAVEIPDERGRVDLFPDRTFVGTVSIGPISVSPMSEGTAISPIHFFSRASKNFAISAAPAPNISRWCSASTASTSILPSHASLEKT
jgi:hypothetical protein